MAYRFTQRKIAPVTVTAAMVNTTSMKDFPALGPGSSGSSGSSGPALEPAKKLDFKKVTTAAIISKVAPQPEKSEKSEKSEKPVVPSSKVVTHCYDEFGEDFDGEEEPWIAETEAEADQEFNANLMEIGTRRNAW